MLIKEGEFVEIRFKKTFIAYLMHLRTECIIHKHLFKIFEYNLKKT